MKTINILLLLVILNVHCIYLIEGGLPLRSLSSSSLASSSIQSSWKKTINGFPLLPRGGGGGGSAISSSSISNKSSTSRSKKQQHLTQSSSSSSSSRFRIGMIYFKVPQVFPLFNKRWQQPKTTNHASSSLVLTWKQHIHLFCDRLRCFFLEPDTYVRPGNRFVLHVLYWLSSWDVINSVRLNKYVDYPNLPQQLYAGPESSSNNKRFQINSKNIDGKKVLNDVYTTLFYFAQLKPRLLYSVGALLRAIQLCTPIRYIFDPIIGVGFGLNLCTIFCGTSRWLKPLILGWTTTKSIWLWLGANTVHGGYVPITLTLAGRPAPPPPPAPTSYSLGY